MADPGEAYRRRGAHWTFNGTRFLSEVEEAKRVGFGSFPGFDHAVGDPVEGEIQVRFLLERAGQREDNILKSYTWLIFSPFGRSSGLRVCQIFPAMKIMNHILCYSSGKKWCLTMYINPLWRMTRSR